MDIQVGRIIEESERVERDAIHVAVMPAIAGEELFIANPVMLKYGTTDIAVRVQDDYGVYKSIGIVDPFIKEYVVRKGQRFWIFLHPGTVTGMRHHWKHEVIDNPPRPENEHELWLREFAQRWGFDYEGMITVAMNPTGAWDYITAHGRDLHDRGELGDDHLLFWQHLGLMTGRVFDAEHREKVVWSCSC